MSRTPKILKDLQENPNEAPSSALVEMGNYFQPITILYW